MHRILLILAVTFAVFACGPAPSQILKSDQEREMKPAVSEGSIGAVSKSTAAFGAKLFNVLKSEGNQVYSPYNISQAMAMAYAGAREKTASEIADAFQWTISGDDFHSAMSALDLGMQSDSEDFKLTTATSIWTQKDMDIQKSFLDTLGVHYGSGVHAVDFGGDSAGAVAAANQWVKDATNDMIPALLSQGNVNPSTRFILLSAIYFKALWKYRFKDTATYPGPFYPLVSGGEAVASYMHQSASFRFSKGDGVTTVELPYRPSGEIAMVIHVPDSGRFADVAGSLSLDAILKVGDSLAEGMVDLHLPKFSYSYKQSLVQSLKSLGIQEAFTGSADFRGVTTDGGIFLADVIHEARIIVDEKGTEAAAATAVIAEKTAAMEKEFDLELKVDRPFIFWIWNVKTGAILFMGTVHMPLVD